MGGPPLIQTGVFIYTYGNTAGTLVFREYCCGNPVSNNYTGAFSPNPGDKIFVSAWYCDQNGLPSETQHYGCTFLADLTSGAILNCVSASDANCPSVPPLSGWSGFGTTADFIIELEEQPAFTDFSPKVVMTGSAYSAKLKQWVGVSTDPRVTKLTDFTGAQPTHMNVNLRAGNNVHFTVVPGS